MLNKKKTEPEKTPEQAALEQQVDAMMDPAKPDGVSAEAVPPTAATAEKPAAPAPEIPKAAENSKTAKTAPTLSPKLKKQVSAGDVPTAPLSIDKLDELAESITGSKTKTDDKPATPEPKDSDSDSKSDADSDADPDEPAPQDDITDQSTELDDSQTDKAVDDIVSYEGDVMLAVADSTAAERNRQAAAVSGGQKSGHHTFSTIIWFLVIIIVIIAFVFFGFLVTGGNLPKMPKL